MTQLQIEIKGLDRIIAAFQKFPGAVARNMSQAGHQAASEVLDTTGLRSYPSHTDANMPPTPYYIRGSGTQTSKGNLGNSERLGAKWKIQKGWSTRISNAVSYAEWVHGEKQAGAMAKIGWRKLFDVAKEKVGTITGIYNRWVAKTLRELGL